MGKIQDGVRTFLVLLLSFILALLLSLLPVPTWASWLRPEFVLLVMIYWVIAIPHRIGMGFAFLIGIVLDVVHGTLLGQHSLAMICVAYMAGVLHRRFRNYHLMLQATVVMLMVGVYQVILYAVQAIQGKAPADLMYWSSILTSLIVWPVLFLLLDDYRHRTHTG